MDPDCFICGATIPVRLKGPELKNEFPDLVRLLCGLLELTEGISARELEGLEELNQQSVCCGNCYELCKSVEKVHEIIVKSQAQLKSYLDHVEELIVNSENSAATRFGRLERSCAEFRRSVLKKKHVEIRKPIPVKEEYEELLAAAEDFEESEDNFDNLNDWSDVFPNNEREDDGLVDPLDPAAVKCEPIEPSSSQVLQQPQEDIKQPHKKSPRKSGTSTPTPKKRKVREVLVLAEEDEEEELATTLKRSRPSRSAKDNAQAALKKCVFLEDEEEDDNNKVPGGGVSGGEDDADSNNDQGDSGGSDENEEVEEVDGNKATSKGPPKKTGGGGNGKKNKEWSWNKRTNLPFTVVKQDLLIYRMETYVRKTPTHLQCLAYKCTFQIPFDYLPSFQAMREHQESQHRDRKYRQRTPHPCVPCNTLFANREAFTAHARQSHNQFLSSLDTHQNRALMCECCCKVLSYARFATHMFQHKSPAEKAAALASNTVSSCVLSKLSLHPPSTERPLYPCQYPNCDKSYLTPSGMRRHGYSHLPKELRPNISVCEECGAEVVHDKMPSHVSKHHNPEKAMTISCKFCEKKYLLEDRKAYEVHLLRHTGERPHLCQECGKSYLTEYTLLTHIRRSHEENEFPCEFCDQFYTKYTSWRYHMKRHHPEKLTAKREPNKMSKFYSEQNHKIVAGPVYGPVQWFPCEVPGCGVITQYRHTLKKHQVKRHGIGEIKKRTGVYKRVKEGEGGI